MGEFLYPNAFVPDFGKKTKKSISLRTTSSTRRGPITSRCQPPEDPRKWQKRLCSRVFVLFQRVENEEFSAERVPEPHFGDFSQSRRRILTRSVIGPVSFVPARCGEKKPKNKQKAVPGDTFASLQHSPHLQQQLLQQQQPCLAAERERPERRL